MNEIKAEADFREERVNIMEKVTGRDVGNVKIQGQTFNYPLQLTEKCMSTCEEDGENSITNKSKDICIASRNDNEKFDRLFIKLEDQRVNSIHQLVSIIISPAKDTVKDLVLCKLKEEFIDENLTEKEDQKFLLSENEEIEIKTDQDDFDSFQDENLLPQSEDGTKLQMTQRCLRSSTRTNLSMCQDDAICETNDPTGVETHKLIQKEPSKAKAYECDLCTYRTSHKRNFEYHLLAHKNPSETPMYHCTTCSFQTKYEQYLSKHMLFHEDRDLSEGKMYQCESCPFQARRKNDLKRHMITHASPAELTIYQCANCSFHTKYKRDLVEHVMSHKDPSEVQFYQCESCPYQTRDKRVLKRHRVSHKSPSELTMYRCATCTFQTKYKSSLRNHMVVHMDPSKTEIYKCESCSYQTIRKMRLKVHALIHKGPSELTMYQCPKCSYQTKHKSYLGKHIRLVHR